MHITPVGAGFAERLHLLVTPRLIGWFDVGVVNSPRAPRTPRFLFSPRVCGALPHPLPLVFAKGLWGAAPSPASCFRQGFVGRCPTPPQGNKSSWYHERGKGAFFATASINPRVWVPRSSQRWVGRFNFCLKKQSAPQRAGLYLGFLPSPPASAIPASSAAASARAIKAAKASPSNAGKAYSLLGCWPIGSLRQNGFHFRAEPV